MIDQLKQKRLDETSKKFDKNIQTLLLELISVLKRFKLKSHNTQNNSIFFENGFGLKIIYYYGSNFEVTEVTELLDYLTQEGSHLHTDTS